CRRTRGSDLTLVAWGNTIEKSLEAIARIEHEMSVELIDLRSIMPWDRDTIEESVQKTRRLVVVQEDTENCSVGQMIISQVTAKPELWNEMISPPILVSKANVMIGYNPIYEYCALPDVERIVAALKRSVAKKQERAVAVEAAVPSGKEAEIVREATRPYTPGMVEQRAQSIIVPVMGEGIRNAKIVSLLKKQGDAIALDDPLCEVETDKAVYPIESSFAGVMGEWKTKVGETVEIGQELGTILAGDASFADQFQAATKASPDGKQRPVEAAVAAAEMPDRVRHDSHYNIAPALSPTITRKLSHVIPANLQIDARWDAIRRARDAAKKENGTNAPSPSVMIAWIVVRAMEKHAPFRRLILEDDRIIENRDFDLGIAVALQGDRLATAVIADANKK